MVMATLEERLKMKRVPLDKWSIREQLCLVSAVIRIGDQNWMSVSRAMKPFAEPNRPPDWFSQKNCAAQYGLLLENVDIPKRKKRVSGSVSDSVEKPQDILLKKLTEARRNELREKMERDKLEYQQLVKDMEMIRNGSATEEMIDVWIKRIEDEEKQKTDAATAHAQWLKEREEKKLEMERAFRPSLQKIPTPSKPKPIESVDLASGAEPTEESSKPALSPLLTSLLKSPAHVPNVTSSILHSAITNQRPSTVSATAAAATTTTTIITSSSSPTIASLLNTKTSVSVSPSLQQLVTTAISQEPEVKTELVVKKEIVEEKTEEVDPMKIVFNEILESSRNETSIVIENDEVLGFSSCNKSSTLSSSSASTSTSTSTSTSSSSSTSSSLTQTTTSQTTAATTTTTTNTNTSNTTIKEEPLDETENEEKAPVTSTQEPEPMEVDETLAVETAKSETDDVQPKIEIKDEPVEETAQESVDVYEFDNNSSGEEQNSQDTTNTDTTEPENEETSDKPSTTETTESSETTQTEIKEEPPSPPELTSGKEIKPGTMEVVEVVMVEDSNEDSDKEMNKKVADIKRDLIESKEKAKEAENANNVPPVKEPIYKPKEDARKSDDKSDEKINVKKEKSVYDEYDFDDVKKPSDKSEEKSSSSSSSTSTTTTTTVAAAVAAASAIDIEIDSSENLRKVTLTPDLDTFNDDIDMEVTKVKRDYSRPKRKDEKERDGSLAMIKSSKDYFEGADTMEETSSEKDSRDSYKKSEIEKLKIKDERSNSPWTEEETEVLTRRRRGTSTNVPLSDSVPSSPASGTGFEDDREYRSWKKSMMLVYNYLATHKYSSVFMKPITDDQVPGYHSKILKAMDFQTLRKNIENGTIRSTAEFERDMLMIFQNAIMYNPRNETVYNMAREMQKEALDQIYILNQAQTQIETPARRETRTSESNWKRRRIDDKNRK